MVTKREFNKIKRENPESRIGQRTWEEQKVRNKLAKTLIDARKKGVETPLDEHIEEKMKLKKDKEVWEEEKQSREEEKQSLLGKIEEIKQEYFGYLSLKESKQAWEEEEQSREEKKQSLLGKIEEIKKEYSKCFGEFEEMKRKQKGEIDAIKAKKPYEIIEHLEQHLDSLSYPEMLKALDLLKSLLENVIKKNRADYFEGLKGNPDKVIADLKENHIKIENYETVNGFTGKNVHIDLPARGKFHGFKFDYFVSDERVEGLRGPVFELKPRCYSMKDVMALLNALRDYMSECGVKIDENIDFIRTIRDSGYVPFSWRHSETLDYLIQLTGLKDGQYLLSDFLEYGWDDYEYARLAIGRDCCYGFTLHGSGYLFLKTSE